MSNKTRDALAGVLIGHLLSITKSPDYNDLPSRKDTLFSCMHKVVTANEHKCSV